MMKSTIKPFLYLSFIVALGFFVSCEKDDSVSDMSTEDTENTEEPDDTGDTENLTVDLFKPDSEYIAGDVINQIEVHDREEEIKIHFLGQFDDQGLPKNVKDVVIESSVTEDNVHVLYDENNLPAFIYLTDAATGERRKDFYEFEMESDSCFSMRIFEMNWATSGVKLERSIFICENENGFDSDVILAFEANEVDEKKHERLEQIRDFSESNISNNGTAHERYAAIVTESFASNLITDGLEWMSLNDETGLDTIANPRIDLVLAGAIAVVVALTAYTLLKEPVADKIIEDEGVLNELEEIFGEFSNAVSSAIISSAVAGTFNPYELMASELSGTWASHSVIDTCYFTGNFGNMFIWNDMPTYNFTLDGRICVNTNSSNCDQWATISKGGKISNHMLEPVGWEFSNVKTYILRKSNGEYEMGLSYYARNPAIISDSTLCDQNIYATTKIVKI